MKKLISLILCICMLLSLAACKKDSPVITDPDTGNKQEETVGKTDSIGSIPEPSKNQAGFYDYEALKEIAGKSDAAYILIEREESSDNFTLLEADRDAFKKVYQGTALADYLKNAGFEKEEDVLSLIEANAVLITESLTEAEGLITNKPVNGENTYIAYNNAGFELTAFGDVLGKEVSPTEYMKSEGLSLKIANAKLVKLIGSQSMADDLYAVSAVVDADVMCFSNGGYFEGIDWIPEKGTMGSFEFIITFMSFAQGGGHNALISDIGVSER